MNLRELIRSVIREEQAPESNPDRSEPSNVPVVSDRSDIHARVNSHRATLVSINARRSEVLADERRIAELQVELNEICRRVETHHSQLQAEYFATDCALQRDLALLHSVCSPQITQFIEWANDEQERLMRLKPVEEFGYGEKNLLVGNARTPKQIFSNVPVISRRLKAVVAARNRAEELRLLDRSEEALRAELESLRALPAIDTLELVDQI